MRPLRPAARDLPVPEHNNKDNNVRKPLPVACQEGPPLTARHLFKTLQWGLILFCLVFSIVGGVAAERARAVLRCQPHTSPTLGTCGWLTNAIGLRLMPFLSAGSIVDYPFVLLSNFWALLLAWGLALYAARWADHHPAAAADLLQRWRPRRSSWRSRRWATRAGRRANTVVEHCWGQSTGLCSNATLGPGISHNQPWCCASQRSVVSR